MAYGPFTLSTGHPDTERYVSLLDFGIWREENLTILLGGPVKILPPFAALPPSSTIYGWGRKKSGLRASRIARAQKGSVCLLEDGFLRSYGTGEHFPLLSLVVDHVGIYYDSTCPSHLENLLNSERDLMNGVEDQVRQARELILGHRLSKYNAAPDWTPQDPGYPEQSGPPRVLVVDQTAGDLSVALGGAGPHTFAAMLEAARSENPGATIFVKTHPEVSSGRKAGYLTAVTEDERTVVLRDAVNPLSLIARMDKVYVVSSTMGFEALLAGKPVTCFGVPWYAGWGVTDDRQPAPRRVRRRSVEELFAAAYFHYTRYINPATHQLGTIFDVIGWLVAQRAGAGRTGTSHTVGSGRSICVGFRRWKAANLKPMLSLDPSRVLFVRNAAAAQRLRPGPGDRLMIWGATPPNGLSELARVSGAKLVRIEDGFVRSVGLGSDLIRPLSLVVDDQGIYFDPSRASELELLLQTGHFSDDELRRASEVRGFIVRNGITKYNLEPRATVDWPTDKRPVVLVPGQVEDDASIRLGCPEVRTNLGLLEAVRLARPDAYIIYKPHPDVASGNRAGDLALTKAQRYADRVETRLSVVSCIDGCDEVHTMSSLTGFDALLRGKKVVTYGQPFYAGWGLTEDVLQNGSAFQRRGRRLNLDELVAGALLRYPMYWDWKLGGYTSCEAVLHRIVEQRRSLDASGGLERLRNGFLRRQGRKLRVLAQTWIGNP